MQRLRQLEASWLRSGQTTSLFASVIEKDDVRDDLGGILDVSVIANPHQANKEAVEGRGSKVGQVSLLIVGGAVVVELVADKIGGR